MSGREIAGAESIVRVWREAGIRGIIFDIDGTLIDSMPIWRELGARYLRSVGKEPEPGLGEILFPMTIAEGVQYLRTHYALPQREEEIRQGLSAITEHFYREEVPAKAGALELVRALQAEGIPMVLATIGERELERAALERLGLWPFFSGMLVCEEHHTTKREPLIYRLCAEHLHTDPAQTLVVEDILQAICTAKAAGFVTAAVADADSAADRQKIVQRADYFLEDFNRMRVR